MPRGGHNKKPAHLKVIQGTKRKDRSNPKAPELENMVPDASESLPKESKAEYLKLSILLNNMGVLTEADQGELENLSIARAQIKHLSNKLFKTSDLKEFRRVQIALNDAIRISASLSLRFGLSPADRDRVSVIQEQKSRNKFSKLGKNNPWEEL